MVTNVHGHRKAVTAAKDVEIKKLMKKLAEKLIRKRPVRDPGRIDPFLAELGRIWKQSPDMRFGQLLVNMGFGGSPGGGKDPWFAEEPEWMEAFKAWEDFCNGTTLEPENF